MRIKGCSRLCLVDRPPWKPASGGWARHPRPIVARSSRAYSASAALLACRGRQVSNAGDAAALRQQGRRRMGVAKARHGSHTSDEPDHMRRGTLSRRRPAVDAQPSGRRAHSERAPSAAPQPTAAVGGPTPERGRRGQPHAASSMRPAACLRPRARHRMNAAAERSAGAAQREATLRLGVEPPAGRAARTSYAPGTAAGAGWRTARRWPAALHAREAGAATPEAASACSRGAVGRR
jgi:hypothetical protein